MTATDIKIVLTRMNTFGDEVFGDPKVLKSYFYAVSDLAVGARYVCCISYGYAFKANLLVIKKKKSFMRDLYPHPCVSEALRPFLI